MSKLLLWSQEPLVNQGLTKTIHKLEITWILAN